VGFVDRGPPRAVEIDEIHLPAGSISSLPSAVAVDLSNNHLRPKA